LTAVKLSFSLIRFFKKHESRADLPASLFGGFLILVLSFPER